MLGRCRVNIYMRCPACLHEFGGAEQEYWRHGDRCRGVLQLDEYANVICGKCGSYAHITRMRLFCNSGRHEFYTPERNATAAAISCSAAFTSDANALAWLQRVIACL